MLCYGGPLDGANIDRSDPTYVYQRVFQDHDGEYTDLRRYTYISKFFSQAEAPVPAGIWPTASHRALLCYIYAGEEQCIGEILNAPVGSMSR